MGVHKNFQMLGEKKKLYQHSIQQSHRHLPFPGLNWCDLLNKSRRHAIIIYNAIESWIFKWRDKEKKILAKSMINGPKTKQEKKKKRKKMAKKMPIVFIYLICTSRKKNVYQYYTHYSTSGSVINDAWSRSQWCILFLKLYYVSKIDLKSIRWWYDWLHCVRCAICYVSIDKNRKCLKFFRKCYSIF